jgi:hypothetical protein
MFSYWLKKRFPKKSRPAARRILVNVAALLLAVADTNEASDASEGFIDSAGI